MDRRDFLVGAVTLPASVALAGCAGFDWKNLGDNANAALGTYAVESAAVLIGYYAAQAPSADTALRGLYDLAMEGKLSPAAVNSILTALGAADPLAVIMVRRAIRMAELLGATVEGGTIIDLAGLDPALVEAARIGYEDGFATYKATV
jgi:hypothetical protein